VKLNFKRLYIGLLALSILGCQGSNLGNSLENAIAPANPSITPSASETIANRPDDPAISSVNLADSDRLYLQMSAIALASLPTLTIEKISLKSLFYIKFNSSQSLSSANEFSDLAIAPTSLRDWLKDLNKLGTISAKIGQEFKPNDLVTRREYAQWLLETNNRLYQNQPSRQIRLAQATDSASFTDIPNKHPNFAIIQGLANAGLINGTGDPFRPNDPLLREELVQWKIPLDLRQPLPNATIETVRESWGFKDSDRISENAFSAVFADSQLRDLSNIRRSFGFTTLLQPQKPVTRAEAAASVWYFGTATDGISVRKALTND
jgi:hypothetical protein